MTIFRHIFANLADLVNLISFGQLIIAFREETADSGEKLRALFLGELCVEGVDGDIDSPSISLKREDSVHDIRCWRTKR